MRSIQGIGEGHAGLCHAGKIRHNLEVAGLAGLGQIFRIQHQLQIVMGLIVRKADLSIEVQRHSILLAVLQNLVTRSGQANGSHAGAAALGKVKNSTADLCFAAGSVPQLIGIKEQRIAERHAAPIIAHRLRLSVIFLSAAIGKNPLTVGIAAIVADTILPGVAAVFIGQAQTDAAGTPVRFIRPKRNPMGMVVGSHVGLKIQTAIFKGFLFRFRWGPFISNPPFSAGFSLNGTCRQGISRLIVGTAYFLKAAVDVQSVAVVNIGAHERIIIPQTGGNHIDSSVCQLRC